MDSLIDIHYQTGLLSDPVLHIFELLIIFQKLLFEPRDFIKSCGFFILWSHCMELLLTSVFGPYAVGDEYGVKENKIELFHNQVTREQGIFSYRFNHRSRGLYFLAENIDIPATVLDFPSLMRFKHELKKGYDYIGISRLIILWDTAHLTSRLWVFHGPRIQAYL
jgi:hypothetical protein